MTMTIVSAYNSTTTPLDVGATFTGTGEDMLDYVTICINVISSHVSATNGLQIQFSSDNTNWDIIRSYTLTAAIGKAYIFPIEARYFRLVYTNGGTLQTYFRLQTLYSITPLKEEIVRLSDDVTADSHTLLTKAITIDFLLEVARGHLTGMSTQDRFGANDVVGTSDEDIWHQGGIITYPAAAATGSVVSTSTNDAAAGTGARTIRIRGLDTNYAEISETVTLNGTTPVTTANSYIRINDFSTTTAGSGGSNVGTITVSIGGNVQRSIAAGDNISHGSHYTVPAGKTAYLFSYFYSTGKASDAICSFWVRPYGEVFRQRKHIDLYQTTYTEEVMFFHAITEKSDIVMRAHTSTGTQAVSTGYKLLLVTN